MKAWIVLCEISIFHIDNEATTVFNVEPHYNVDVGMSVSPDQAGSRCQIMDGACLEKQNRMILRNELRPERVYRLAPKAQEC